AEASGAASARLPDRIHLGGQQAFSGASARNCAGVLEVRDEDEGRDHQQEPRADVQRQVQSVNAYASLTGADGASGQNAPATREAVRRSKPVKKSPGVKSGRPRTRSS